MGTVVYEVSLLKAFSGGLWTLLAITGLGIIGVLWAIFKRKEKAFSRIATGCASVFLLIIAVGLAIAIYLQWQDGVKSVSVQIDEKKLVKTSCNKGRSTCTSYLLETNDGEKLYDFTVSEEAFNAVDENACYAITYYPSRSLYSRFLGRDEYTDSYEKGSTLTQIVVADCP